MNIMMEGSSKQDISENSEQRHIKNTPSKKKSLMCFTDEKPIQEDKDIRQHLIKKAT
jgi:hypothetical protein